MKRRKCLVSTLQHPRQNEVRHTLSFEPIPLPNLPKTDTRAILYCLEESFLCQGTVIFPWMKKPSLVCLFPEILSHNICICTTVVTMNRAVTTTSSLSIKCYKISINAKQNAVVSPFYYLWTSLPPVLSHSFSQDIQTQ